MTITKTKEQGTFGALAKVRGYGNVMQAPKLVKVVVSAGIGSAKDKNRVALVADRLAKITGQKPAPRAAKKSIASFKVREGDVVGYQVTLRGKRMHDFLDRLIHVALPRTRDFRGLSPKGIDAIGNYTLGLPEHMIFPETADEEARDIFGFSITVVTTAKSAEEAKAFLEHLGFPFKKSN